MKHQNILRVTTIAAIVLLGACSNANQGKSEKPISNLIYSLSSQPGNIDPHVVDDDKSVIPLRQIYDTLVYRDPKTRDFVPGLATSWTISDDGLSYTFNLRNDVQFHDGTPFNAQSVAANLDRIMGLGSGRSKKALGPYDQYRIIDDYTIHLHFREPFAPLMDALSQVYLGIASPAAINQYSSNRYQFHQVGTGPYSLEDYVPGERIVLRRNPLYKWGPRFYEINDDSVDEITFQLGDDVFSRIETHNLDNTNSIGEVSPLQALQLAQNPSIRIMPVTVAGQPVQFMINTQQFPTNNLIVRQALLYSINRNLIVDTAYQRFAGVAWGPLSMNSPYAIRDMVGIYAYDLTQARNMLQNIGYQDTNDDGVLEIGGIDLSVSVLVPPWDNLSKVGQMIQKQWGMAGIKVTLEPLPTLSKLKEKVQGGSYNLVPLYSSGLDPLFLSQFYSSGADNNWSKYSDANLDEILREGIQQNDPQIRRQLYIQSQQIIMNNALILPIVDQFRLVAISSSLGGLEFDAYGIPILINLRIVAKYKQVEN